MDYCNQECWPKRANLRLNYGYTQKMETPRTQRLQRLQRIGAFVTANEVAMDIQRVIRNHLEELGVEHE